MIEESLMSDEEFSLVCKQARRGDANAVFEAAARYPLIVNMESNDTTIFMESCAGGHIELVEKLYKFPFDSCQTDGHSNNAMMVAARYGHLDIVNFLELTWCCSVKAKNKFGDTALHFAAWYGHIPVCELLIVKGADLMAENEQGQTALDMIVMHFWPDGEQHCVKLSSLFEKGTHPS